MKITNRIAGAWQSFDEANLVVKDELLVAVAKHNNRYLDFFEWSNAAQDWADCDDNRWTTAELAEEYDAFCIIRGPWEGE